MPRTAKDPAAAKEISAAQHAPALSAQAQQDAVSEGLEEYELPRTLITRIAKSAVPDNAKMGKDVSLSIVKASTVFINYLAATAHDVAAQKQHKSISASDVLKALELLELGDMVAPLQRELDAFRAGQRTDKGRRGKGRAKAAGGKGKEKAPTITIAPRAAASAVPPHPEQDGETEVTGPTIIEDDVDDEEAEEEEGVEEDEIDDEDEVEDEGEEDEQEDQIAVEGEELVQDARGLNDAELIDD